MKSEKKLPLWAKNLITCIICGIICAVTFITAVGSYLGALLIGYGASDGASVDIDLGYRLEYGAYALLSVCAISFITAIVLCIRRYLKQKNSQ